MIQELSAAELPESLHHIEYPPKRLFVRSGSDQTLESIMSRPRVAIVGSRMYTPYGRGVTAGLASDLAAHGVVIVSGLALGIDAIAHQAALDVGGLTVAVLPGPVEDVYPRSHTALARQILANDGLLISEYPKGTPGHKSNFVARNRIVSGLSCALLITEAVENSGTLHTARFALRQGIDVLAVPGNITSPSSIGVNNLIKSGATPVTDVTDILHAINMPTHAKSNGSMRTVGSNEGEQQIIDLLEKGICDGSELLRGTGLGVELFNHHLTMLEITAKIRPLGANQWALR